LSLGDAIKSDVGAAQGWWNRNSDASGQATPIPWGDIAAAARDWWGRHAAASSAATPIPWGDITTPPAAAGPIGGPMPAGRPSPAPIDPFGGRTPGPMQGPPMPPPRAANPSRSGGAAAAPIDPYGGRTPLPDETQPPRSVGMGYYMPASGIARQAQYIDPSDPRWRRR
jgi:hypothetical protein